MLAKLRNSKKTNAPKYGTIVGDDIQDVMEESDGAQPVTGCEDFARIPSGLENHYIILSTRVASCVLSFGSRTILCWVGSVPQWGQGKAGRLVRMVVTTPWVETMETLKRVQVWDPY